MDQEHGGIIRHGAKMLYAYSEATVPMVTVILRKAYGGGWAAMSCRELGVDQVFAWPIAELAVMGPEGAADVIWEKEIKSSKDPEAARKAFIAEYNEKFANPYRAAELRLIDDVIYPAETRKRIIQALGALKNKQKPSSPRKHGVMPT